MRHGVQATWSIRRATDADSEAIACFQELLHRPSRSDSVSSEYFLAEAEGNMVGCAAVRTKGQLGYLYGLAVNKSWRRHGIGHALTDCRLNWLRETGADSAFVFAMFWNIRFFKQHGFKLAERKYKLDLVNLHHDFIESWSSRSALLIADLPATTKRSSP
jgi:N-acetylglutamate synthase-like GNAT family acetyltransferase